MNDFMYQSNIFTWINIHPLLCLLTFEKKIGVWNNHEWFNYLSDEGDNEVKEKTNVSQDYYLRSCKQCKVVPVSTFYKQLAGKSVVLKYHPFIGDEFKPCALALLVGIYTYDNSYNLLYSLPLWRHYQTVRNW